LSIPLLCGKTGKKPYNNNGTTMLKVIPSDIMMDIQTDQTQPQEILLITRLVILLALIQAMDSIRQPIAAVGLMDT
jgi:hypothetical protein